MAFSFSLQVALAATSEQNNKVDLGKIESFSSDVSFCLDELVVPFFSVEVIGCDNLHAIHYKAVASECLYRKNFFTWVFDAVFMQEFQV